MSISKDLLDLPVLQVDAHHAEWIGCSESTPFYLAVLPWVTDFEVNRFFGGVLLSETFSARVVERPDHMPVDKETHKGLNVDFLTGFFQGRFRLLDLIDFASFAQDFFEKSFRFSWLFRIPS